ncbi:hypothetical protein LINPERPRIM_LOCUS21594 [Linum perenne]
MEASSHWLAQQGHQQ